MSGGPFIIYSVKEFTMSIQLVLMKSGEDVVADVYEMRDDDQKPIGYILRSPQIVRIMPNPEDKDNPNVTFENWVPLSSESRFLIKDDAFLTITTPLKPLIDHYIQRFGESDDELANSNPEEGPSDPDAAGSD